MGPLFPKCPQHHLYHPYEILAEMGSKFIIDGYLDNREMNHFFKRLDLIES